MIVALGVFQNIVAVISAKAGEGLVRGQATELGKSKDLAGAFIATHLIDDLVFIQAVAEASRLISKVVFYGSDDVIEFDRLGC